MQAFDSMGGDGVRMRESVDVTTVIVLERSANNRLHSMSVGDVIGGQEETYKTAISRLCPGSTVVNPFQT